MADFPTDGGSEDSWGAELVAFFERQFNMSGTVGGKIAAICKNNEVVCKGGEIVTKAQE